MLRGQQKGKTQACRYGKETATDTDCRRLARQIFSHGNEFLRYLLEAKLLQFSFAWKTACPVPTPNLIIPVQHSLKVDDVSPRLSLFQGLLGKTIR